MALQYNLPRVRQRQTTELALRPRHARRYNASNVVATSNPTSVRRVRFVGKAHCLQIEAASARGVVTFVYPPLGGVSEELMMNQTKTRFGNLLCAVLALVRFATATGAVFAQSTARTPADHVFPDSTKIFVSIPDPATYRSLWRQTELGKLFRDRVMEAFAEDLRRQLDEKLTQTSKRLGLRLADLDGIAGGELAFGLVRLPQESRFALALLVDISGRDEQVHQLQQKVRQELVARGGQEQEESRQGYTLRIWTFSPTRDNPSPSPVIFCRHGSWLVAGDHLETVLAMLRRLDGRQDDVLARLPAYRRVMERTTRAVEAVHLRWFVVPLDLAQAIRDAQRERERGRDKIEILRKQGFDCLQGVGGVLQLASGAFDSRYEIYVYAPQEARVLAARMLDFPTQPKLTVPTWATADASGFLMANWQMRQAFEASKTLVDSLAGSEVFEDALRDIELDPNGLRVNLRKEFIAYLGTRVYMLTRHSRPITPQSEQRLIAFELTDAQRVLQTMTRALPRDPSVKVRQFGDYTAWEIIRKENIAQARPQGFQGFRRDVAAPERGTNRALFKNGAMAVAYGSLFVANDVEFLGEFLLSAPNQPKLADATGYQLMEVALSPLGQPEQECCRYYVYLAEALETDYELFRSGKMVESETLLGQMLNYFLAPDEEGLKRKPLLDGSKLPPFERIKQYLPHGGFRMFVEPDGWRIAGGLLARDQRRSARHE